MTTRRRLVLHNDGTVLERLPDGREVPFAPQARRPAPRVQVGDHWPEMPACLRRGDGAHIARLLALPSHMPVSPAA